jgi:hypothetical protein
MLSLLRNLLTLSPWLGPSNILYAEGEAEMTERRRAAAQYLNGLAVAVLATAGSSVLAGSLSPQYLVLAGLLSATLHALAVIVST